MIELVMLLCLMVEAVAIVTFCVKSDREIAACEKFQRELLHYEAGELLRKALGETEKQRLPSV